jgi:hypothetical protein
MKASEKQIEFCTTLKGILQFWITSNDIDSPSHFTIIEEVINNELEPLPERDKELLINAFGDLLTYVRKL